jgi:hypothetical protein
VGDHKVTYAINGEGNRAASASDVSDPSRPTLLIIGESIGFGHALAWEDTFGSMLEHDLGLQVVNLSVSGFGTTQQYQRLIEALPRFLHPVAVIIMFVPHQIARDSLVDRPHMALDHDGVLALRQSTTRLKLTQLVDDEPYHGDGPLALTRAVLHATVGAVRARGARPLIVITNFGPSCQPDKGGRPWIVQQLFDRERLPYVFEQYGPSETASPTWNRPGPALWAELHPGRQANRRIADAVEEALRSPER